MIVDMTYKVIMLSTKKTKRAKKNLKATVANEALFVTSTQIATALGYTPKAVRQMIARGDLPGRMFGGEYRMHKADFEKITRPQLTDESSDPAQQTEAALSQHKAA